MLARPLSPPAAAQPPYAQRPAPPGYVSLPLVPLDMAALDRHSSAILAQPLPSCLPKPGSATGAIRASGGAVGLLDLCVARRAAHFTNAARRAGGCWLIVAVVLGMIVSVVVMAQSPLWGAALFIIAAIGLIVGIARRSSSPAIAWDERRAEVAMHLLAVLGPETSPKRPIEMALDFTDYASTSPVHSPANYGTKQYEQTWLSLSFILGNGVGVSLKATLAAKVRTKHKRRYTVTKERLRERLLVRITPPRGQSLPAPNASSPQVGAEASGLRLRRIGVWPQRAQFELETELSVGSRSGDAMAAPLLNGRRVLDGILLCYRFAGRR